MIRNRRRQRPEPKPWKYDHRNPDMVIVTRVLDEVWFREQRVREEDRRVDASGASADVPRKHGGLARADLGQGQDIFLRSYAMIDTTDLPPLALSVRQPWAWAIIHAGKDIENRGVTFERKRGYSGLKRRIAIHASSGMTRTEYLEGADFMATLGVQCPKPADLIRGGIIGAVTVTDVVRRSSSPWFFGPLGLVLAQAEACEPIPCSGQLGYFGWKPSGGEITPPAKWMMPATPKPDQVTTGSLL